MLSKCSQSCRRLPSMVWCPIPWCCDPNFPVREVRLLPPGVLVAPSWHVFFFFFYSRKYTIDRWCCIKDKNAYLLHGAIQLSLGKFCMQNFRLSLYASTAMVLGVLLTDIVAEQILSSIAGQAPCSIMCYLVRIEKSPVLTLPPGKCRDFCQFNMSWSKVNCFNLCWAGLVLPPKLQTGWRPTVRTYWLRGNWNSFHWFCAKAEPGLWKRRQHSIKTYLSISPRKKCPVCFCFTWTSQLWFLISYRCGTRKLYT